MDTDGLRVLHCAVVDRRGAAALGQATRVAEHAEAIRSENRDGLQDVHADGGPLRFRQHACRGHPSGTPSTLSRSTREHVRWPIVGRAVALSACIDREP
jgi:hypothetical protein